jgi:hypothetical protein
VRLKSRVSIVLCLLGTLLFPALHASAQAGAAGEPVPPSRFEVYAGYGYFRPFDKGIGGYKYQPIYNLNAAGGFAYYFGRHIGVQMEGTYFSDDRTKTGSPTAHFDGTCAQDAQGATHCFRDQALYTGDIGPVFRWQFGRFVPYVHLMGGAVRLNGPVENSLQWGWDAVGGGGVDYVLPFFHDHLAVRAIQADYHAGNVNYGPLVLPAGIVGGSDNLRWMHLSAGLVFRTTMGTSEPEEVACSADPGIVYPGDSVHLSATARGMQSRNLYFSWTAPNTPDGGNGASAFDIQTRNLAPGHYEVNVRVSNGQRGKVRRTCTTSFEVHKWDPPTVSCAAQPSDVMLGGAASIMATGVSPQNRGLTYSYEASSGSLSGVGSSVQLQTSNAQPGPITVTCNVVDDLGQRASASTTVNVEAPRPEITVPLPTQVSPLAPAPLPPVTQQEQLCTLSFERDRRRPTRVDNEAKACLDSVALSMGRDPYAKLVIVGTYTGHETMNTAAARALHAKQYMTEEKGIDPSLVQTMIKSTAQRSAETVLLPSGAIFEEDGTLDFDPLTVHLTGEAYGKHNVRHR